MTKPKAPSFVERVREDASRYLQELLSENERLRNEFVTVQEQISDLANLYVAVSRVTESLERSKVVSAIEEVVVNIVGSDQLAIFELNGATLRLVSAVGVPEEELEHAKATEGVIGRVATSGESYIRLNDTMPLESWAGRPVNACIPLSLDGRVVGLITLFRLLPQKPSLTESDVELLKVLGTHGGTFLRGGTLGRQG